MARGQGDTGKITECRVRRTVSCELRAKVQKWKGVSGDRKVGAFSFCNLSSVLRTLRALPLPPCPLTWCRPYLGKAFTFLAVAAEGFVAHAVEVVGVPEMAGACTAGPCQL